MPTIRYQPNNRVQMGGKILDGETMLDKSHEPFNKPYKTNGDTEQMILSVRYDHPTWEQEKIKRFLKTKGNMICLPSVQ